MRRLPLVIVAAVAVPALVGACLAGPAPTSSPVRSAASTAAAASASPALSPTPTASGPSDGPAASAPSGQTDTEWGRIWDDLPRTFPTLPGAIPSPTRAGPVSAELALPTDVATAATWYSDALTAAGYRIDGASEPLEDGSVVIDASGASAGCSVRVTLTPLSGTTHATILFGAGCPFA
jgi:hypothetical protein